MNFLRSAHFQLTVRCNLRCSFCGQARGMVPATGRELGLDDWRRAAAELQAAAVAGNVRPQVTLWGGEPLLSPHFPVLAAELSAAGFELGVVTNGTLIDRHAALLSECFDVIQVSLDGPAALHDAGRGAGVFERVKRNLAGLRSRKGRLVFLTTVADAGAPVMAELPEALAELGPDEIVLQPLMYLSGAEIARYRHYSRCCFGVDYPELSGWRRDDGRAYRQLLKAGWAAVAARSHPVPVRCTRHAVDLPEEPPPCRMPFERVHLRWDGEVGFCTDYFGFSAGNIRERSLTEIFTGEPAERFRRAVSANQLPICRHCVWRNH